MIGNCDCCDRTNVPVSRVNVPGEPTACFVCQGDTNPDPYCEIKEPFALRSLLATMKSAKEKGVNMNIWDRDIKAVEDAIAIIEAVRQIWTINRP